MGFCIHIVLKLLMNINYVPINYVSFRIFDLDLATFVQTCHWPCLEHQIDDLFILIHFVEGN